MGGFNNETRIKNVFNDEKSIYCESDIPAKNLQKWLNIVYPMFEAFLIGDYYNFLWAIVFIIPVVVPRLKDSLSSRIQQAKNYLKSFLKK